MYDSVSHPYDLTPWDFGVLRAELLRKVTAGLTDYFQFTYYCLLHHFITDELLVGDATCKALDGEYGIQDMLEIDFIIPPIHR